MKNKTSLLAAFILFPAFLFSQTGTFWFSDTTSEFVNNRIISIKENSNGDLFLLGKASDGTYNNPCPYWAVCDKAGKLKSQSTLPTTNKFYELNNFTICSADRMRIWGTEIVNDRMTMSLNTINATGQIQGSDAMMTNTATLTGDVCQLDKNFAVLAKTVQSSSTGKYHISIYKYNVQDDQQTWYKTLATEDNEEASKVFAMKDGSLIVLGKLYNEIFTSFISLIYKLDANGELVWKKTLNGYSSFYAQGVSEGKNKSLIYICSTSNESVAECSTKIFSLDSNGTLIIMKETDEIRANGVLTLANGNIFLYGSRFQTIGQYIISKGSYKIYDPSMKVVKEDMLGIADGPDAYLPGLYITMYPTASDFLTAIQLADGRIACGGTVYMPFETSPGKIEDSERYNRALLVIMDVNGNFRN
ncbi:MAG: hypothetical protein M3R17_08050 [Bacteroidota bacterium]|nr:hypothetical protein [Bacteroidota bacterium]